MDLVNLARVAAFLRACIRYRADLINAKAPRSSLEIVKFDSTFPWHSRRGLVKADPAAVRSLSNMEHVADDFKVGLINVKGATRLSPLVPERKQCRFDLRVCTVIVSNPRYL
jgi:hypothetical protein